MKYINCLITVVVLWSCGAQKAYNKTVPYKDTVILINQATEKGFQQEPFSDWYNKNYAEYQIDKDAVETLQPLLKNIKVKAFMGTWCGDSKRETPRFFKIMDAADYRDKHIELIAMSRQKDTPLGFEKELNITNVPTFIFYKNGKEINRIVESPIESLEKDMIAILSGKDYKHTYAE